tara:strand:+ start:78 stop:923 length:846 start_codon:yes stop_codon:yes gene_type:complete
MKYEKRQETNGIEMGAETTMLPYLIQLFAKPNMVIAEVGVWKGESLRIYIDVIKKLNAHVYLIDWWKGSKNADKNNNMAYKEDIYEEAYQKVLEIIDRHNAHDNITILKGDTVEMSKSIPDKHLDLCFIDADHSYQGCKRDIQAYLPKVKKGGIMSGDDMDNIKCFYDYLTKLNSYSPEELQKDHVAGKGHPGVHAAVWELFGTNVNTFQDSWYTFVGYKILRGAVGIVDINSATKSVIPLSSPGGMKILTNDDFIMMPKGWSQQHVELQIASGKRPNFIF